MISVIGLGYVGLPLAVALAGLVKPGGLITDIKGTWRRLVLPESVHRWQL